MSILQLSLSNHIPSHTLSSSYSISGPTHLFLTHKFSLLTLTTPTKPTKSTLIRMGGGPRTFPGGVSKWQWKRMQAKKAKQLLRARLARERQIYEMRKRAELKAAVAELERPWEVVEKAPTLFSASADEQVKVLADRFQKPGGFDMWSEKDGPQLFQTVDGGVSNRFFPKGVVHSVKPYGRIGGGGSSLNLGLNSNRVLENGSSIERNGYRRNDDGDAELEDSNDYAKTRRRNWYKKTKDDLLDSDDELGKFDLGVDMESEDGGIIGMKSNGYSQNSRNLGSRLVRERDYKGAMNRSGNENSYNSMFGRKVNESRPRSGTFNLEKSEIKVNGRRPGFGDSRSGSFIQEESGRNQAIRSNMGRFSRRKGSQKLKNPNSEVFDMNLQNDGSYGFSDREFENPTSRKAEQQ